MSAASGTPFRTVTTAIDSVYTIAFDSVYLNGWHRIAEIVYLLSSFFFLSFCLFPPPALQPAKEPEFPCEVVVDDLLVSQFCCSLHLSVCVVQLCVDTALSFWLRIFCFLFSLFARSFDCPPSFFYIRASLYSHVTCVRRRQ